MKRTPAQISNNMRRIKSKDTEIEVLLRKELWKRGLRYRKNVLLVYGHPDIAFMASKIAVFCDSEFWHGYDWKERKHDFKVNQEFWHKKIESNIRRDEQVNCELKKLGWTVLRFWGNEIKKDAAGCADVIEKVLNSNLPALL